MKGVSLVLTDVDNNLARSWEQWDGLRLGKESCLETNQRGDELCTGLSKPECDETRFGRSIKSLFWLCWDRLDASIRYPWLTVA